MGYVTDCGCGQLLNDNDLVFTGVYSSHQETDGGRHCGGHCHTHDQHYYYKMDVVSNAVRDQFFFFLFFLHNNLFLFSDYKPSSQT